MSEGWQVGDLALCVSTNGPADGYGASTGNRLPRKGAISKVEKVIVWEGAVGLVLEGWHADHPTGAWCASAFRKIKPDTEPCEEEFVTLLKLSKPTKVSSVLIALAMAGAAKGVL